MLPLLLRDYCSRKAQAQEPGKGARPRAVSPKSSTPHLGAEGEGEGEGEAGGELRGLGELAALGEGRGEGGGWRRGGEEEGMSASGVSCGPEAARTGGSVSAGTGEAEGERPAASGLALGCCGAAVGVGEGLTGAAS